MRAYADVETSQQRFSHCDKLLGLQWARKSQRAGTNRRITAQLHVSIAGSMRSGTAIKGHSDLDLLVQHTHITADHSQRIFFGQTLESGLKAHFPMAKYKRQASREVVFIKTGSPEYPSIEIAFERCGPDLYVRVVHWMTDYSPPSCEQAPSQTKLTLVRNLFI